MNKYTKDLELDAHFVRFLRGEMEAAINEPGNTTMLDVAYRWKEEKAKLYSP